jgi:succinate-semialdehyde dehydrogenase/glutarate-semialdehyde dehydrogenase
MGPMVSKEQFDLVCELVDDAVAAGAKRLCGGPVEVEGFAGHFIAPVVLTDVTHDMRIMREEIFGPVLPIMRVQTEDEGIALANDSQFGLGASVWTLDRDKGERIAHQLQAGMVWINDHSYTHGTCQCAWGGVKDSGLGRSHSKFGFYECVNIKTLSWEPSRMADAWWHPYDETLGKAIRASMRLIYGRSDQRRDGLRDGALPLLKVTGRAIRAARR